MSAMKQQCFGFALTLFLVGAVCAGAAEPQTITVDFSATCGTLRPLHGINKGPLGPNGLVDLTLAQKRLRIPSTRLHDCHHPNPTVVDMHAVFPNPDADPTVPENYDFRETDEYIAAVRASGAEVIYRLGQSIEHQTVKRHVHPPRDPARWAAACAGIVRHYNQGWANGFHYGIRYWEIWNEPENRPVMWTGTDAQFLELYQATSRLLRSQFPDIKIGGPGFGYCGAFDGKELKPSEFCAALLDLCRRETLPLDFFSWHCYTNNPAELAARAVAVRRMLDAAGFTKTESHLNEWNYLPGNSWDVLSRNAEPETRQRASDQMAGADGGAFLAASLVELQDAPVDVCNFYHGETGGFGLFTEVGMPTKNYYAMLAFSRLLDTPKRVRATGAVPGKLAVAAGISDEKTSAAVLVANLTGAEELRLTLTHLPWDSDASIKIGIVDGQHSLEPLVDQPHAASVLTLKLPPPSVALITLRPKTSEKNAAILPQFPTSAPAVDTAGVYQPKTVKDVKIDDPFWLPKLHTYRDNSIPAGWKYVEGPLQELEHLAKGTGPKPEGVPWGEANLYKFMEAAAYAVAQWPEQADVLDPAPARRTSAASLRDHLDAIVATMEAAQAKTGGYLNAFCVNHEGETLPWGIPVAPWGHTGLHDGYVAGHLIEAAVAHHNATGSDSMLNIARKVADQAYEHFVTQNTPGFTEHAELELALIELYRATGESKYIELAQHLVEQRGRTPSAVDWKGNRAYCQDDLPIRQQTSINGHAVRAVFYYTGVADLALAGRRDYDAPIVRVWKNATRQKMYVTGGVGAWDAEGLGEAFAPDEYHLVNDFSQPGSGATCYCESCAAGGMVNLAHRMGRLKGAADCIDELERAFYNNVLHGISLDGKTTYYRNPLTDQNDPRNNIWVCCPPLLLRTLLGVGKYIYGSNGSDIYVNLFIGSSCTFQIGDKTVPLTLQIDGFRGYPDDGGVTITVAPPTPTEFTLRIRCPGWCRSAIANLNDTVITDPQMDNGYFVIHRQWSRGDRLFLSMKMTPTRIEAHPSVTANAGRVCIQLGPIIYALEGVDNGGGSLADPVLSATPELETHYSAGLGPDVQTITANKQGGGTLTFVPFYRLANRGDSWQRVWVRQEGKTVRSEGWEDRLYREYTP
jgi:DUF1680 family protein